MFKINRRALLGLAPVLTVAAFAVVPAGASAAECRVLTSAAKAGPFTPCNEPPGVTAPQNLRANTDGSATTPKSENFGADALAVNTAGPWRYSYKTSKVGFSWSVPAGDVFFGVKLQSNPESSATVCRAATGTIPWVDIQHASPSAVFDGSTAWTFSINSDHTICSPNEGSVTIGNVTLLLEQLGAGKSPVIATGTISGKYINSTSEGAPCQGGGVELYNHQPGITMNPASENGTIEIDNGTTGKQVSICFVSSNNYLFPNAAPTWAPFTDVNGITEAGLFEN
jgi:hypothetical protein